MKKTILFLLALITLLRIEAVEPSDSPSLGALGLNLWVFGLTGLVVYDLVNQNHPESYIENGFFVSFGLDSKMAIKEEAGDFLTKIGYAISKNEFYLSSEAFKAIDYYSLGTGYNRMFIDKKLSLLGGLEYVVIYRHRNKYYHSIGANIVFRYNFNCHFSVEVISNLKLRPDISKDYIFGNYLNLYIKF